MTRKGKPAAKSARGKAARGKAAQLAAAQLAEAARLNEVAAIADAARLKAAIESAEASAQAEAAAAVAKAAQAKVNAELKAAQIKAAMDRQELESLRAQMAAIDRAQGVVEFELDGTIVSVNKNFFLDMLGYSLDEVRGKHHRMFVDPGYAAGPAYRAMWELLGRGEWHAGQFKRIGKDGREVWVQASYNPILDSNGKPYKVVKYASDVTEQVLMSQQLVAAVQETKATIDAASHGDLTRRIGTHGKTGDVAVLCAGVNSLLEAISAIVEEVNATVELGRSRAISPRASRSRARWARSSTCRPASIRWSRT